MTRFILYRDRYALHETSALLAYRFRFYDCVMAFLTGCGAFLLLRHASAGQSSIRGNILGAMFAAGMLLIFKAALPLLINARVVDLTRNILAFTLVCAAGALGIVETPAFQSVFSAFDTRSVVAFVSILPIMMTMRFVRKGDRSMLALAYFLVGALFAFGCVGILSLLAVWLTFRCMRLRLAHLMSLASLDVGVGATCVESIRNMRTNIIVAYNSRILCALSFLFGLGLVLAYWYFPLHADVSPLTFLCREADSYADDLNRLSHCPMAILLVGSLSQLLIAIFFARRATDIYVRLRSGLMLLYSAILFIGMSSAVGLVQQMPFFAGCGTPSHRLFVTTLTFGAFVLAAYVLLIELACRVNQVMLPLDDDIAIPKSINVSRHRRKFQGLVFGLVLFSIIAAIPLIRIFRIGLMR